MASPFSSRDHYPVFTGRCFCGADFTYNAEGERVHDDLATFHLDIHILGPVLAGQINADRLAATQAIHAKAADMLAESDGA